MTTHQAAAGSALPEYTLPPLPETTNAHDLWSLHQAVQTIMDVVDGLMSQPRFAAAPGGYSYSAAGEALSAMSEGLLEYADHLVNMARALPPGDEYRARLLLENELACFDGMARIIALAGSLAAEAGARS